MNGKQFGIDDDGWDTNDLKEVMDMCTEFQIVNYELQNCRRGSYAGFGDTPEDLIVHLVRLKGMVEAAIVDVESQLD